MHSILSEGVRWENDKFVFDFTTDLPSDIVFLKYSNTKSKGKRSGITVYCGWNFNKQADPQYISSFRKALKQSALIDESDKNLMISKAVIGFDSKIGIDSFDIVISPKSSSSLTSDVTTLIKAKSSNLISANEILIKNSLDKIHIDYENYLRNAKTPEEREKKKKQLDQDMKHSTKSGKFEIKKVHQFRKQYFKNYLKFDDDTSRTIFNAINEGNVLLVDDYITTGTTLIEMIRIVTEYNPKSITCFFLIK